MFNWLIKRIFSDKNIGYMVEKAQPKIKEALDEYLKEAIIETLHDEEVMKEVVYVGDALFARYRNKVFGTIGGLQKGLNAEVARSEPQFDLFDDEGRLSIKKILPMVLSGRFGGLLGGKQAQTTHQSQEQGRNAPNM